MHKSFGITVYILILIGFAIIFFAAQQLLMPKYTRNVYEGLLTAAYYAEEKNHELLFIGDCEVYENFSPVRLFNEYGITTYIRGGAQQLIWHSYYILKDTLKYETPKVVVFNVLAMKYGEPQSEGYNRLNLDGLRLSVDKIAAAAASKTSGEDIVSYVFPILRYHERWKELNADDFKYFFHTAKADHNGYLMRSDVKPVTIIPEGAKLTNYTLDDLCWVYLDKIRALCEEKGVQLVLIKAPSIWPYWYDQWDEQIIDYAAQYNLPYYNMLAEADAIGIDYTTDTYDAGLHLNVFGAEKLSVYFGAELLKHYDFTDFRLDEKTALNWQKKTEVYQHMKEKQLEEISLYGEIITYRH